MSLVAALEQTEAGNPRLQAARARLRQTDETVPEALSGWRPHISIEAQVGPGVYQNRIDKLHDPEHRAPQDYELSASQTLYASGRVSDAVAQARTRVLAQRAMLLAAEQQALLAAASAYLDVVRDRDILALNQTQQSVLAHTLHASHVALAAGDIAPSDLSQAEARLARQQSAAAEAAARLAASEAAFEQVVGVAPGVLTLPAMEFATPPTQAEALSRAMAANPDLVAARHMLEASRLGVELARDALLPEITLDGLLERQRQYEYEMYAQSVNAAQALVRITVPLYQGGGEYARIREAKQGNLEAQDLLEQAARDAARLVHTGWAALQAARVRLAAETRATRADRLAERGLAGQQRVGARTTIDLLNAQQETLASQVAVVAARSELLQSQLTLLAATGALTLDRLEAGLPRADPKAHYEAVRAQWAGESPPADAALRPRRPPQPGDIGR